MSDAKSSYPGSTNPVNPLHESEGLDLRKLAIRTVSIRAPEYAYVEFK